MPLHQQYTKHKRDRTAREQEKTTAVTVQDQWGSKSKGPSLHCGSRRRTQNLLIKVGPLGPIQLAKGGDVATAMPMGLASVGVDAVNQSINQWIFTIQQAKLQCISGEEPIH